MSDAARLPEMTPTELKERLDQEQPVVLVDVREPHEWQIADLGEYGPVRMPMGEFLERMRELDPSANVVVYCRSGGRSAWAVRQLLHAGYSKVFNLKGGILAWRDEVDPSLSAY
ncbi:MAG: rhodanese-like domain-containing protein [Gemmatimonadota bacterium]